MKKIILSSAAAIFCLLFSSFSSPKISYYWFYVTSCFDNTPTTYDRFASVGSKGCVAVGGFYCQNGYTRGQLNPASGTPTSVKKTANGFDFVSPTVIGKQTTCPSKLF